MVKQSNDIELTITQLTDEGLGRVVVHDDVHNIDRSYQVRNALPGETVTARILRRRKGIRFGDALDIKQPNPGRQPSACSNFPRCGGCSMHHMKVDAQLSLKQGQLERALCEHGVVADSWSSPQSALRLGYRRKARLGVRKLGDQVLVGFRESFSNRVAKITSCEVLTPELSRLIHPLKIMLAKMTVADKIPQIEVAQGDGKCVLMLRHLEALSEQDIVLAAEFEQCHGVIILLQSGGYDTLTPLQGGPVQRLGYHLYGAGLYMEFLPQQFTQVNQPMNQVLIRTVLAYLGDIRGKRVADMFCGIGNFTLPIAKAGAKAWGFEAADDAIAMAQSNAQLNALTHCSHFAVLDLYSDQAPHTLPAELDALVLDPPRSGAGPNLGAWLHSFNGTDIVYVSCNPKSFATDAAQIVSQGFSLSQVGIFDMFPNTAHVETIGHFKRQPQHG